MARQKTKKSGKKRSQSKILDAFQIAERSNNRKNADSSDDDGDDLQVRDGIMDARKFMKNQGDGDDSDLEDEELDSDEALGSEDEYDVLNSTMSQSIRDKQKRHKAGEYLDPESEDEAYDSIDETQLVTLSQAWDMDDRDMGVKPEKPAKNKSTELVFNDDLESSDESEEDSGESDSGESGSDFESENDSSDSADSESEDEEQMLRGSDDEEVDLAATASTINLKVQKAAKKYLVSETIEENEFSVPTRGAKLSMAEMMAGMDPSVAPLIDQEAELKPVAVPLPKRIQQRHDRKAAYEITKEEVSKWQDTVKALNDADHLQFPLAPPATQEEQEEIDAEAEVDALQFVPQTQGNSELENKINGLLKAGALLDESKEATFEQIQAAKLSKDELFKRTQELRRMRELMFRDEQRAKRIKKIKSKLFHKIRKRERLRDAELVEGLEESDTEDHDMKRAQERMSLRHKTQGKWAKSMIKSGITKDALTRAELEEMLRQGERLRAKQLGYEEGDQSDGGVSDIEREYANDDSEAEELERGKLGKGVLAMDFMKQAEERKRKENKKEMEFIRSMAEDGLSAFAASEKNSINQLKNEGRRVYSPSVAAEKQEMEELDEDVLQDFRDDEAKSLENRMRGKERPADSNNEKDEPTAKRQRVEEKNADDEEFAGFDDDNDGDDSDSDSGNDGENPWLMDSEEPTEKSKNFHVVTEESSRLAKAANKIRKNASKSSKSPKENTQLIDMDAVLEMDGDVHGSDNEVDQMFRQQSLIKEAFAGDDVTSEFLEEKQRKIEEEDDKEEDLTLPGWGDWAGSDKPQKPRRKFVQKIDGVAQKDKRRDKNLQNVIINETANKHNLKYQSSSVPFPYESREQYERALRMPIGEEWSSRATHQKITHPRVIVKQGTVVNPLTAPFK